MGIQMKNTLWAITVGAAFTFMIFGLTYTPASNPPPTHSFPPLTEEQRYLVNVCFDLTQAERNSADGLALCQLR